MLTTLVGVTVGCVFVVSGTSKLAQGPKQVRERTAPMLADFPPTLVTIISWFLAPLELGLGVLLLVGALPRAAATIAAVVLACFVAVLARAVVSGRRVSCNCFGATASRPVTRMTVVRTAALGSLSVMLIVWPSAESAAPFLATDRIAWLVAVSLVWMGGSLLREAWRTRQELVRFREVML